jgi:inorganic triphosphatase YgiF
MTETELKFQVPAESADAVRAAVQAEPDSANTTHLQAAYFDTSDRALAAAGVALRIRREDASWMQTVKAGTGDTLVRLEHNAVRDDATGDQIPQLDLSLHRGTPVGKQLRRTLGNRSKDELVCRYRTDIVRTWRRSPVGDTVVELAFDEGAILAGDLTTPVCEVEFELLDGTSDVLIATARTWVAGHGLWLETRSKAERGGLLAQGALVSPARSAAKIKLRPKMRVDVGRRVIVGECLQQISVNASQVASGDFDDEHVHQLRVGLRRLRTALRLLPLHDDGLTRDATALFRALGASRNQAAIAGPLGRRWAEAMTTAGLEYDVPHIAFDETGDPCSTVRDPVAQAFLLNLISATIPTPGAKDKRSASKRLARRLNGWHRSAVNDMATFAMLDDPSRHRLRRRCKRLRYGVEFGRSVLGRKRVARYLAVLGPVQHSLGEYNDISAAIAALRRSDGANPGVAFALGWLERQREVVAEECAATITRFLNVAGDTVWAATD